MQDSTQVIITERGSVSGLVKLCHRENVCSPLISTNKYLDVYAFSKTTFSFFLRLLRYFQEQRTNFLKFS